jgi:hypothetical protein
VKLEPRPSSHLYPIADESYEWTCGTDARGLQVFLYIGLENLVGIFFASDGALAEVQKRELPEYTPSRGPGWREAKELSEQSALDAGNGKLAFLPGQFESDVKRSRT